MKYTYAYKTSDGTRHEATMDAASRDEVFKELRKKGIKAIKVVAADGSKANGEIRGIRRRVLAASVVGTAVLVGVVVYFAALRASHSAHDTVPQGLAEFLISQTRRQVVGDAAIVEKGISDGWADVFPEEGERFLASFAIPGVPAGQRNTTEGEINAALSRKVAVRESDGLEARQIKAMVEGMKEELRAYLADGGNVAGYGQRIVRRQLEEVGYYERAKNEIENAKNTGMTRQQIGELWETRNESLRLMGIRLVPMPK